MLPKPEGPGSVFDLIQHFVKYSPNSTAVSKGNQSLTYSELEKASQGVAALLVRRGVSERDLVPLLTSRCLEMAACLLAIVRIGAAWVPMEIGTWGRNRIDSVVRTLDYKVALVTDYQDWGIGKLIGGKEIREAMGSQGHAEGNGVVKQDGPSSLQDVAYIIFTSGTTGVPKGVMIKHESLLNYVWPDHPEPEMPFNLGVKPSDTSVLLFSVAFDAFYGVLFSTWCNGGQIRFSEVSTFREDSRLCTLLPATPSLLANLEPANYQAIRGIFLGGEAPSPDLIKKWWTPNRRMYNAYGPTETTVSVTMAELRPDLPITLGRPIRNSKIFLLNADLRECSEGELCVAGTVVLALGYYKNSEQTAAKFLEWNGQRIYCTGDMAKRTESGLVFLGRKDQIVKNRGFLINIESEVIPPLLSCPGIVSAMAVMHRHRLLAFIAPKAYEGTVLRAKLSESIDHFLVPDEIVTLDQLPRTANGKIDSRALLAANLSASQETEHDQLEEPPQSYGQLDWFKLALADALGVTISAVDMEKSFSELGGNSMNAIKALAKLRQRELSISIPLLFQLPCLRVVFEQLQDDQGFFVSASSVQHIGGKSSANGHLDDTAERATADQDTVEPRRQFPMTYTQKGLIRSTIRDPPTGYMLVSIRAKALGEMSDAVVSTTWERVLSPLEVFRSRFELSWGYAQVEDAYQHDWESIVVTGIQEAEQMVAVKTKALADLARSDRHSDGSFVPANAFRLIQDNQGSSILLWLVHHALLDGWSVSRIIEQVHSRLSAHFIARPLRTDVPFSSYAEALEPYVRKDRQPAHNFWTNALDGFLDGTQLKTSHVVHMDDNVQSGEVSLEELGAELSLAEFDTSARAIGGVSPAVVFHAAWALLLRCYSNNDKVVFGSALSARNFPVSDVEDIIGPLLNQCPVPVQIHAGISKSEFLSTVQNLLLHISQYQWSSSEVLEEIAPGSHRRLFTTAIFLEHDLPIAQGEELTRSSVSSWSFQRTDWPDSDLTLQVQNLDGLSFRALFKRRRYGRQTITRLLHHFQNLCLALIHPEEECIPAVCCRMLGSAEQLRMLRKSSLSYFAPYLGPNSLKEAFESGVNIWGNATALETISGSYSYKELDNTANCVAKLISATVSPGRIVAILGDGSVHWLIGALAIIKAGGTYLPLDTKLPPQRMSMMMETAAVTLCLYPNAKAVDDFPSLPGSKLLLDEHLSQCDAANTISERLPVVVDIDSYAYIMFTSGSTGKPKGVRVTHRATLSHFAFQPAIMHARPGRRHAQMFSPGFDVSIAEVFGTLCNGATLVLKDSADPFAHLKRVHATMITPSFLAILSPSDYPQLDTVYLIGEAVSQDLSDRWSVGRTLYNFYGPCECTIAALYKRLQPEKMVTIGTTLPRVGVYLLDGWKHPVPIGVPGEIYLSGVQVMSGYIGKETEAISTQVFLSDPFTPGQRMYRTGDRGVWTESMELRFLGRVDHQIKVRGYRVELGEVEHVVQQSTNSVRQVAAIVAEDTVFAFVTPKSANVSDIEVALRRQLPSYAVPELIFTLDSLPTTPNQKLDRLKLAKLAIEQPEKPVEIDSGTPRTRTEQLVEDAWREAIGLVETTPVTTEDDFMLIGGNSLRQFTVANKVCSVLRRKIPLGIFITNTRLRPLAQAIDNFCRENECQHLGFLDYWKALSHNYNEQLSPFELELFHMHSRGPTPSALNVAHIVTIQGDVELSMLKRAIERVVFENDILRTSYRLRDGRPERAVSYGRFTIECPPSLPDEVIDKMINTPFDLGTDQLTRVGITQEENTTTIVLVQHHIITDQVTLQLFFARISQVYSYYVIGEDPKREDVPQYSVWVGWKSSQKNVEEDVKNEAFWKSQFANITDSSHIWHPTKTPLRTAAQSGSLVVKKPGWATSVEAYMSLVAMAWNHILGSQELLIGIPFIDRSEPGTAKMLGVFLDTIPVNLVTGSRPLDRLTLERKSQTLIRSAIAHALCHRRIREVVGRQILFDIMLVYNRTEEQVTRDMVLPGTTLSTESRRARGAKFPVLLEFTEIGDGIAIEFEYFEEVLSLSTVEKLLGYMTGMLEDVNA